MWLDKLSTIIDRTPVGRWADRKADIVANTDPDRIHVESVREFFGVSRTMAETLCNLAVREGLFEKRVAVYCPNDECERVLATFAPNEKLPKEYYCELCEVMGREQFRFSRDEVKIKEYYKLIAHHAVD